MRKYRKTVPELFNDIDLDGNGYLSKVELKNIFKNKIVINLLNIFISWFLLMNMS